MQGSTTQPVVAANPAVAAAPTDSIRVICNKCHAAMRVPLAVLRGKTMLNVRCPQCKTVIVLRPRAAAPAAGAPAGSAPTAQAATPAAAETKPAADAGGGAAKSVAAPATAGGAAAKSFGVKAGAQKHGAASPAHTGSKK
jgi:predicted Zn finger-like uncharacterized protein